MVNYPLPQPEECVVYINNTMLINEGFKYAVVDYIGRDFKGENCESLAKEVFDELVKIENKILPISPQENGNALMNMKSNNADERNAKVNKIELLMSEIGIGLVKETITVPKYWIKDAYGHEYSKMNDFKKAFSIFYSKNLRIEKEIIMDGKILYKMGSFSLLETKDIRQVFYIIDENYQIIKKYRTKSLANDKMEEIYRAHDICRTMGMRR